MIEYDYVEDPPPGAGQQPAGDWVRLIPHSLEFPRVIDSVRRDDADFVSLDIVCDLKLFDGNIDLFGHGPNLIVSRDFKRAFNEGGFEGLEFHETPHATPVTLRMPGVLSCRPTHYATKVADHVELVPPTHPRGRSYGYHGRPAHPLDIVAPAVAPKRAFGAPWFATFSLPFQPLVCPTTFLASFRQIIGREPRLGWADISVVIGDEPLAPRTEPFGVASAPTAFGRRSFAEALAAARQNAPQRGHVLMASTARPGEVSNRVWADLRLVAGSIFFGGAMGFFAATEADRAALDPALVTAGNVPESSILADPLTHSSSVELGYPLAPSWTPIGWFTGEMPALIVATPTGEIRRCEATGEVSLHYPTFGEFFADVMADLDWAYENDLYQWQWFGA